MTARSIRGAPKKPSLIVLGDLLLEVAAAAVRPIEEGSDVPGTLRMRRGGSAANVAVAFSRLGGKAALIAAVGRDGVGHRLVEAARDAGVTSHVVRVEAPTARLLALLDGVGERSFVTERAAADRLTAVDLRRTWFRSARALHLPGYSLYNRPLSEAAVAAVAMAREAGALVSVDLSSRAPMLAFGRERAWQTIGEIAPNVLFANVSETAALARSGGATRLLELASCVVVKEGAIGCRVLWRGPGGAVEQLVVATTPVAAADTTGAGDAFAAGFLFALQSSSIAEAPRVARPWSAGSADSPPVAGPWSAALLRRAAVAGHRCAANLLGSPRTDLAL